jgi:V8-like Glu-specific endopeptidase
MIEIHERTGPPYSAICYVQVMYPDGTTARGSAVVVGPNDVLTALHVVYEPAHGGWAKLIDLAPGADTRPHSEPFGHFGSFGSLEGRAATWDFNGDGLLSAEESAGDLALIGMNSRIGDITGWLPLCLQPNDFSGQMVGYPAAGTGMMAERVWAVASPTYGVYDIEDGLGSGASGGPLLVGEGAGAEVAGVLSSGAWDASFSTYAGFFTAETWAWLQQAMTANDRLVDALPLAATRLGTSYVGNDLTESWIGNSGADTFSGGGGDDLIDGARGVDTCVYRGGSDSYSVTVSAGIITVADRLPERDGTDTLSHVERLKFADLSMAFDVEGTAGEAYRLYQAAFDRAPDLPGLGYQIAELDNSAPLQQVAANFIASPEFQQRYGALTNEQFVRQLYLNVLHRAAEPEGLAYHLNNLDHNGFTRADVLLGFSDSPENKANVIGAIQNGMYYELS